MRKQPGINKDDSEKFSVKIKDASFSYGSYRAAALSTVNLEIPKGNFVETEYFFCAFL